MGVEFQKTVTIAMLEAKSTTAPVEDWRLTYIIGVRNMFKVTVLKLNIIAIYIYIYANSQPNVKYNRKRNSWTHTELKYHVLLFISAESLQLMKRQSTSLDYAIVLIILDWTRTILPTFASAGRILSQSRGCGWLFVLYESFDDSARIIPRSDVQSIHQPA